jgi:hypothetical protein
MTKVSLTRHACERLAQRGLHLSDVDLIMEIGSEVDDGFMVREKDLQEVERTMKRFMNRVRRLKGKRLVVSGGFLVTAFHARRSEERRLLRTLEPHL